LKPTRALISALIAYALVCPAQALAADPTPAPAAAITPTAKSIELANRLMVDIGLRHSLDLVVPEMLAGLEERVAATRPELKDAIHDTVFAIAKDMGATEKDVLDEAARSFASHFTEQELTEVTTFLETDAGKKYLLVSPAVLAEISQTTRAWREKLSTDILDRARVEMKKRGFDL